MTAPIQPLEPVTEGLQPGRREGLRRRLMRSAGWALTGVAGGQAIRLATNVLITRWLAPDVFGLMAVVYLLGAALGVVSDLGLTRSLMRSPRAAEPALLDTAWTLHALRGAGLTSASLLVALGLALARGTDALPAHTVYADPRLPWLIAVFAVHAQISGLESIRVSLARRGLHFHRLTRMDLFSQAAAAACMIGIAWFSRSVWTLALGGLIATGLRVGLGLWLLPGHRERFRLDAGAVRELMRHARWNRVASILDLLAANGDRVLLAAFVGGREFGLYAIAVLLCSPLGVLSSTLGGVVYPAFAEVARERPRDLARAVARFLPAYDLSVVALAGVAITAGGAIVRLLYDDRYQQAGWMLSILAVGAIGLRSQVIEQCYQAVGKPQYNALAQALRLACLAAGIGAGRLWGGLEGMVVAVAASQFAPWPLAAWFLQRHGALNWRAHAAFLPTLAVGLLAGWLLCRGIAWWLPPGSGALRHSL